MINRLQLLRNVGQFESVAAGAKIPLARLSLIYAENARGKTTLAAILRSLKTGDPLPIAERRRLAALHPPHVVIECDGGPPLAVFQNNAWNRSLPSIIIFDDNFIDQNVHSGLSIESDHRQRLHELILGERGIDLNRDLQQLVARVEEHNRTLRARSDAIPAAVRGALSVDDFCTLQPRDDIDSAIQEAERAHSGALEQVAIRNAATFESLTLPDFDVDAISALLNRDLAALNTAAAERVHAHLLSLGEGGEAWLAGGMNRLPPVQDGGVAPCPFCTQDLAGSPVIEHYRAYFSEAYVGLKNALKNERDAIERQHGGDPVAAFERGFRVWSERRQFWSRFCDVPDVSLDTGEIARAWRMAREVVLVLLRAKQAAPLEQRALSGEERAALAEFDARRADVAALNERFQSVNGKVALVKERAAAGDRVTLASDVARLKAVKARHGVDLDTLCTAYLAEKGAKATTEALRDRVRIALDQYRATVFPAYQTAINIYLQRFNAGFRLDSVNSINTRGGSSCIYNVIINNETITIAGTNPAIGVPAFRNTLSAGDRSTLALAFFFASLDQDQALAGRIVVIDDPITSMDEHRSLTTVQEMRRLSERTAQVIVLSHDKPFLCRLWEGTDPDQRVALELARDGAGSTVRAWDVHQDSITEHDRRHALLRQHLDAAMPNSRLVVVAIRPVIEAFLRVAYPEHFPPGTLLGPFRRLCEDCLGSPQEILDQDDIRDLSDLTEYANRFHHDTNPAWETEYINDAQLLGFVRRTLNFVKR
ncbi:MAG: AAA family ATPase [Alphaproteobacteria bacterium]